MDKKNIPSEILEKLVENKKMSDINDRAIAALERQKFRLLQHSLVISNERQGLMKRACLAAGIDVKEIHKYKFKLDTGEIVEIEEG